MIHARAVVRLRHKLLLTNGLTNDGFVVFADSGCTVILTCLDFEYQENTLVIPLRHFTMATNRVNLQEIEPSSRRVKTVGQIIKVMLHETIFNDEK